jgi:glycosyltransferase involved in cell wall biosynthesis
VHKPSVLVIHNHYQQSGGEDTVVRAEVDLLRRAGHRVVLYTRQNAEIAHYGSLRKSLLFFTTSWAGTAYSEICALIRKEKPDVAHCHNFLPLVSPAAHYACGTAGVPVLQTLHNYRLLCPSGTFFQNGQRCSTCGGCPVRGILRGCYRHSHLQTGAVSLMLASHGAIGTWKRLVDAYIAPSRFCRDTFVRAGWSPAKIYCKPNFLPSDPGQRRGSGEYALFVGRLSPEKGVLELFEAWRHLSDIPLLFAGDGPLHDQLGCLLAATKLPIKLLGRLSSEDTISCIKGARFLIFPSQWHEPFGMGLLEAAACGVPVIASRIGAIPEVVDDRRTGLLFDPDDCEELAQQVRWAWTHPAAMEEMGLAARARYLQSYTSEKNYQRLTEIYHALLN